MADVEKRNRRPKRRRMSRFQLAIALFIAIVVVSGALACLLLLRPGPVENTGKPAAFGIQHITVTGESHYDKNAIIGVSGIREGQSIFSVNKVKAHDNIMTHFPYIERVEVGNTSLDTVEIRVWEVDAIGAMYANGSWLVVGSNNKGVEELPVQGDRPNRYLYFKGAEPADGKAGGKAMSDRCFKIVTTLRSAMEKHGLTDVGEIDLSEITNIKLNWKNQITVLLGNETNLEDEISFLVSVLPRLLEVNGQGARGVFDVRTYADGDKDNDRGIFTPADLLSSQTTAAGTTARTTAGTAAGTTAAH